MDVNGGLNADGSVAGYDFATRYPSNGAPTLALLLTGGSRRSRPCSRWATAPRSRPTITTTCAWSRTTCRRSCAPPGFAASRRCRTRSRMNPGSTKLAAEAGVDPIEYRLRYLKDPRAIDLVNAVAERAGWKPRPVRQEPEAEGDIVRGRGFAYALYVHSKFPGYGAAWSAWIADVAVNKATGDVSVTRVVAGQDSGLMINPDGVRHQIHGNVIQSTSRALMEEVSFDRSSVTAREWGAYPIIKFPDVPKIDVLMLPRQDQPPLGVGESASVPSAAAIANAIYDATGVRFRELPFTPERILKGLRGDAAGDAARHCLRRPARRPSRTMAKSVRRPSRRVGHGCRALRRRRSASAPPCCRGARSRRSRGRMLRSIRPRPSRAASNSPRSAIARSATPSTNGILNAGGRPLETPFGTIYSTNITPDVETGIGAWSYPAFERAMREGIHRDGRHLYPAFPYTHFAKTSDADLQALYAYLMAQSPVRADAKPNALAFPFNLRPLLAGWNALFHTARDVPARSGQIRDMESRRLSGRRPRPLQRLPFAAQRARRGTGQRLSRRRICRRLGSAGADVAVAGADPVERGRAVRLSALRRIPLPRRRRRTDGAGREGTRRAARPGHPRHGGLSRLLQRDRRRSARRSPPNSKPRPAPRRRRRPASAPGSIRAPARYATRSAARRCSAAGRRWR